MNSSKIMRTSPDREVFKMEEELREILERLKRIPLDDEGTKQYYIYYKEDMRSLLEYCQEQSGLLTTHGIKPPWEEEE